jgi:hypothetical protein
VHARSRLLLCSLAATALVLGCTDDGPQIDEDADQELVDEVALTVDDLPDGFEEQAEDDDGDDASDDFEECEELSGVDQDEAEENEVAVAGDDVNFVRTDVSSFTQVTSQVTTYRDADLARRQIEAFQDDEFLACGAEALEEQFAEESDVVDFTLDTTSPAADGDASFAVAFEMTTGEGIPISMEMHGVLVGRVGISVIVVSAPEGVDEGIIDDSFDAMLDRLEAAQE